MSVNWPVRGNGPIRELDDGLWCVEGDLPKMPMKRLMVVARRDDGSLLVHNAIAMSGAQMTELDGFGPVRTVIVPNGFHRIDGWRYKARYPEAQVLCPSGMRKSVEKKVQVDGTYEDFVPDGRTEIQYLEGIKRAEGVLKVSTAGGVTLVFNDMVFNLEAHFPGSFGFVYRMLGSTGGPRVPRLMRLFTVRNKRALRAQLQELSSIEGLRRIIPGHGRIVEDDAAGFLASIVAARNLVAG